MTDSQQSIAPRQIAGLLGWLALCFAAESSGVAFLPGRWYAHLQKAPWTPPSYLFAPIWTVIYIIMAVAAWLVWRQGGFHKQARPLGLFLVQLLINAIWSFICFRMHNLPLSVTDMAVLWLLVFGTTLAFFRTNPLAGWLMAVYLAWITFAASLNIALWHLNS